MVEGDVRLGRLCAEKGSSRGEVRVEGIEKGLLVRRGGLESVRGGEPLVDFCFLRWSVAEVGEGRHGPVERWGEPDGAWENTCREQFGGLRLRSLEELN